MPDEIRPSFFRSLRFRYSMALLVFLSVGGFLLWEEHKAHILGNLPLILILGACVGMHFFMHSGHSGAHDGGASDEGDR